MDSYAVNSLDKSKILDIIKYMTAHLSLINNFEQNRLFTSSWLSKLSIMKTMNHVLDAFTGDYSSRWKENAVLCLCQIITVAETRIQQVLIHL